MLQAGSKLMNVMVILTGLITTDSYIRVCEILFVIQYVGSPDEMSIWTKYDPDAVSYHSLLDAF